MAGRCVVSNSVGSRGQGHVIAAVALGWLSFMVEREASPEEDLVDSPGERVLPKLWPPVPSNEEESFFTQALKDVVKFKSVKRKPPGSQEFLSGWVDVVKSQLDASLLLTEEAVQNVLETRRKALFKESCLKYTDQGVYYAAALLDLANERVGGFEDLSVAAILHNLKSMFPDTTFKSDDIKELDSNNAKTWEAKQIFKNGKPNKNKNKFIIWKPKDKLTMALGLTNFLSSNWTEKRIPFIIYNLLSEDISEDWLHKQLLALWGRGQRTKFPKQNRDQAVKEILQVTSKDFRRLAVANGIAKRYFSTLDQIFTPEFLYWAATGAEHSMFSNIDDEQ
eukprot:Protomagalhaensia_wolfi_Nauph_80__1571@NODE_1965_length_1262_cov_140_846280_g1539_i0_p1_GENE_NODE_1965_length_1262_cov_140_846280_g1539_i0NODE_1965_length_1262_cov_140_846280_g1539_i0_p1_ORF_typecomplete_len336_score69_67Pescadillo_N/PF06732_11/0_043_NODE_1965_length_1262_cov_140_846280_g1539_i01931200